MLDARLTYAVAVSRSGSFTAAAESTGVTQSTVTKAVADLEQRIGFAIFHRTSRGAVLTEDGRDFIEQAARLLDDSDALMRRPKGSDDAYAGPLRIGVCPASLEWRLIKPVELVLRRHPSIRVDILTSNFERMVQLLRHGGVDVAIGLDGAFSDWADIRREPLTPTTSVLFVRRDHPLLSQPDASLRDILQYGFVSPSEARPNGAAIRRLFEREGLEWQRYVHTVDYFPIVERIVATTDAIGAVSVSHARSSAFGEKFATLDYPEIFPATPIALCCAIRSRWTPKPAVRAFMSALRDIETKNAPR